MDQNFNLQNQSFKNYNIKLPKNSKFDIGSFCEFLKSLSKTLKGVSFSFSINVVNKMVFYCVHAPVEYSEVLENQIYTVFPEVEIEESQFDIAGLQTVKGARVTMSLRYGDFFPFLNYTQLEGSFLSDVFSQLNRLGNQDVFSLRVKMKPVDNDKMTFNFKRTIGLNIQNFKDRINIFGGLFSKKSSAQIRQKALVAAQEKNRQPLFLTEIELLVFSDSFSMSYAKLNPLAQSFRKLESEYNDFNYPISPVSHESVNHLSSPVMGKKALHLSAEEISTILHFPIDTDTIPNLYKILSPKGEPPLGLPTKDNTDANELCLFATSNYRNMKEDFGIKRHDRTRHMYMIGKSGSGKSKLLELLIKSDIQSGQGVCVIDPHGDLVENIIPYIPESRVKDVVFFNATDENFPISFNPIEKVEKIYRQQVASGFIEIFRKSFGANWTPRLEHVLRMTILALLDAPKASVMSILLLLTDRNYRQEVVKTIDDQVVKNFWTNEFAGWSEKFDNEAIMPILNKIGQFISDTLIRNIVGQDENKIQMPDLMNNRKILLVKLPKGILGEENTSLLGSMLVTKIYHAALARSETPENERVPFYLYVDEFQNFATENFADILSESRKFKLSLTIAHQYISQLRESVKKTVFGNVGTIISFRTGPEDAAVLEKEFEPRFKSADITNLAVREIYLKMSINDETKEAFSARTLAIEPSTSTFKDQIVENTRANYCQAKTTAEKEIKEEKSKELEILEKLKEEAYTAPII